MKQIKSKIQIIVLGIIVISGSLILYNWSFAKTIVYAGNIDATRVDLPSRLPTIVSNILVQEGEQISKDQVLIELACDDLQITQKFANQNFARSQKLYRSGNISQEAYDNAAHKKEEIQTKMAWCTVKSPISGTVLTRYLEPGEWTNPGTKMLSIADLDDMYAYIYVPQETMANLKVGQELQGKIPEIAHGNFTGTIRKINDEAEFTPKNVQTRSERTRLVYGVKVALPNQDRQLKPGMTIELEL